MPGEIHDDASDYIFDDDNEYDDETCEHGDLPDQCALCSFDCGLMADGQCSMAGTEDCDWECPWRDSELFAGSAAWNRKRGIK